MKTASEQRAWPRHKIRISLSLKYTDSKTFNRTWHPGETRDVSVDGMRIVSSGVRDLLPDSMIEILCFPPGLDLYSKIRDPEPVSMTGMVMWQDVRNKTAGIRLNS